MLFQDQLRHRPPQDQHKALELRFVSKFFSNSHSSQCIIDLYPFFDSRNSLNKIKKFILMFIYEPPRFQTFLSLNSSFDSINRINYNGSTNTCNNSKTKMNFSGIRKCLENVRKTFLVTYLYRKII